MNKVLMILPVIVKIGFVKWKWSFHFYHIHKDFNTYVRVMNLSYISPMSEHDMLWTQRANAKANTLSHFGNFLYEFVGARFTFIAFVSLFNFAAIGLSIFDEALTFGIVLILYYLISDAFNVFWTGVNLEYTITRYGLVYKWGIFRSHELFIPFDDIKKVYAIRGGKKKRNALVFENELQIKNKDHGFSKELHFNDLTFENIKDLDHVIKVLEREGGYKIEEKQTYHSSAVDAKLSNSYLYLKFMQLLTLIFLYFATTISLNLIDSNMLTNRYVKDVVIEQDNRPFGSDYFYDHLITEKGHTYVIGSRYFDNHVGEEVELVISPIFKKVIGFVIDNERKLGALKNGYVGSMNILFKLAALICSFVCASYIFYKRCFIPFDDLTIFLVFPVFILVVAFFLFH